MQSLDDSGGGGGNGGGGGGEISGVPEKRRSSCSVSESYVEVDLESGEEESKSKGHFGKSESRDCRICHMSLDAENPESGLPVELGCSCKDDLSVAHRHCAEAWFKIRGNKTCEICGTVAQNVVGVNEAETGEEWSDAAPGVAAEPPAAAAPPSEARNFWQGHRFLNFLLACMVFAFVMSWLFHFNVPS